jgi:molybdate/tungstate transport system substrate-binding protein
MARQGTNIRFFTASFFLAILVVCLSCNRHNEDTLRIIHAGSLSVPVREAVTLFEEENPGVRILTEAWGSKAGARRISDLDVPCDLFISADYKVIEIFLMPEHASWNISFAGNEMSVVFTDRSRFSDEISSKNWYEVLLRDEVIYGRSDPDSDPCGVRTVLLTQLAEHYYDYYGLSGMILSRHGNMIRPKETDLIALLEKNALDYIFLYRSVAEQHGLRYLELPDSLNLSKPELNDWYARARTELRGTSPGKKMTETGEAMIYGITIPHKSENLPLALAFTEFFLSPEGGLKVLEMNGQNPMVPTVSGSYFNIPESLRKFALPPE